MTPAERVRAVWPDAFIADDILGNYYICLIVCAAEKTKVRFLGRGANEPAAWISAAANIEAAKPMVDDAAGGDVPG